MQNGEVESNPYKSPEAIEATVNSSYQLNFRVICKTLALGVFAGFLVGAFTGAINGALLPSHFWRPWPAAILHGSVQGASYGLLNALAVVGIVKLFPPRIPIAKRLLWLVAIAMLCDLVFWAIGGTLGVLIGPIRDSLPMRWSYDYLNGYWSPSKRWVLWSIESAIWGSPFATFIAYIWALRDKPLKVDSISA